jgi:GNAT superfamily N-acetyltransferase
LRSSPQRLKPHLLSIRYVRAKARTLQQPEFFRGLFSRALDQIHGLLANVNSTDRAALLDSLAKIRSILSEPKGPPVRVVRLSKSSDDAIRLLQEYYEAVSVVQRDTAEAIQKIINEPTSRVWLAYLEERAVGCVVLRKLGSIPFAGECKRLYVQPTARGHRIAGKLSDAQEDFARSDGLHWIYLDSHDDLKVAKALYRKRGYVSCRRYNDNPQATVFLRKKIRHEP